MDILSRASSVIQSEIDGLCGAKNMLSESFADAVNIMHECSGHVVVAGIGKPGHIGKKISATLSSTGTESFFIHPSEANHGDLGMLSKNDVLLILSYSGETQELFMMLNYAKRFGIPIIGITGNIESTLGKTSTAVIEIPKLEACPNNLAPTTSTTVMLAIGDAMAICLLELNNFTRDDFKKLHPGGSLGKKLLKVEDLMHSDIPLVKMNDKMKGVIIAITTMSFGCAGVVNENEEIVGVITDGDLRRHISDDFLSMASCEVMTENPIVITRDIFAAEATKIMNEKKITSLFVVHNKIPVGLIHIHDCLRAGLQ